MTISHRKNRSARNPAAFARTCARALAAGALYCLTLPADPLAGQDGSDTRATAGTRADAHAAAPVARATRLEAAINLDGRLDDAAWEMTVPVTEFYQTDPVDGAPATERTEVYILYDDAAIYIGARLWESTGEVRKRLGRRDSFLMDSDWFYVMLDSYHDHQRAYQFSVNPAGVKRDEVTGGGGGGGPGGFGRGNASWDAVWNVATSVDAEGWTVEMRIPFSQLRFSNATQQTWGIQFSRRAISKEETTVFAFTPKSQRGGVARYGHLEGLEGIEPGRKMELLPYTVARAEYVSVSPGNPFRDGSDYFGGAGADMKYRVTSSMTLDATVNPDFGQVEADPAVVNLTAFETSFDEKRPFFIEGADIFRFNELRLFYSRRIGRAPQGSLPSGTAFSNRPDNSTILAAGKLTGQTANGWNIGLVEALTAEERATTVDANAQRGETVVEPMTNYVVARAEKNLRQGQSTFGAIATAVNRSLDDAGLAKLIRSSAYAGGVDFSHQFLDRSWEVGGYMAYSRIHGSTDALLRAQLSSARYYQRPDADYVSIDSAMTSMDGYAGRIELRKVAGLHWRGEANISAVSPGFEINDAGFQTAADRVGADLNIMYVENRVGRTFRNYRINLRNSSDWNHGWERLAARTTLSAGGQLANYWGGNLSITRQFEGYDDRLTRGGPLALDPAGNSVDLRLNTDSRKQFSFNLESRYSWGESGSWNGNGSVRMTMRPAENWSLTLGPRLNRSHSDAQYLFSIADATAAETFGRRYVFAPIDQTTLSMETRVNMNFTPDLSLEVWAQPFVSTGDFGDAKQLRAPRIYAFAPYTGTISNRDFTRTSLRGNAVMRWEWRPGSTLFLVWQQQRSGSLATGEFDFGRDTRGIFEGRPDNVFLVKMNYWLNF